MGWKETLKGSYRRIEELEEVLGLTEEETRRLKEIEGKYPICVTPYYLSLICKEDRKDPIRKMCIPDAMEFSMGGEEDTSGEGSNTVMRGVQHKYKQTVLILSTNQCAMYCRHCFRKRLVGTSSDEIAQELPEMEEYIRNHPEVNNVLISGGDAFMNSTEVLERYLERFTEIPGLDFIRFGTRIPVVLPQRIIEDESLLQMLKKYSARKQLMIVTQFNHPRELTQEAIQALRLLRENGCIVRNQTVLLKGVNDNPKTLAELMNGLVRNGVIPYYIFQCRPVAGVKNQFQVPLFLGSEIVEEAKKYMNGQSKSVRYAMSHPTGKIEILGRVAHGMLFKYHQAKDEADNARIFVKELAEDQSWLGEI